MVTEDHVAGGDERLHKFARSSDVMNQFLTDALVTYYVFSTIGLNKAVQFRVMLKAIQHVRVLNVLQSFRCDRRVSLYSMEPCQELFGRAQRLAVV